MALPVQYGHHIDLMGLFQLIRATAQKLATDPSDLGSSDEGRFWYNTTSKTYKIWDGSTAIDLRNLGQMTGSLAVSKVTGAAATATTRLSDFVTAPNAAVPFGGQKATGLADGTAASDAATKGQLDAVAAIASAAAQGIAIKAPVRAVDTVGVTQTGTQTVDGVPLNVGDRYLRAVGSAALNGIWVVQSGAHTRATDADQVTEIGPGTQVRVTEGAQPAASGGNADSTWAIISDAAITPGTTAHAWDRLPGSSGEVGIGGAGLTKTGVTYDVGAGDGIAVDADAVRVNPLRVRRKRTGVVPSASGTVTCDDGTTMAVTVTGATVAFTHNLGSPTTELLTAYHTSPGSGNTQGAPMKPGYTNDQAGNVLTADFPAAPSANQYRFDIEG